MKLGFQVIGSRLALILGWGRASIAILLLFTFSENLLN